MFLVLTGYRAGLFYRTIGPKLDGIPNEEYWLRFI